MPEPISTTASGAYVSAGIMALLVGWLGDIGADVMMVSLSALTGCFIALSNQHSEQPLGKNFLFIFTGLSVSLITAWSIAGLIAQMFPMLSGAYLPSIIAIFIGFLSNRLSDVMRLLVGRGERLIKGDKND